MVKGNRLVLCSRAEYRPMVPAPERADYLAVVLKGRLQQAVKRLNPDLPPSAVEEVVHIVSTPDTPD